jgi:F5/8 type C domain
MFRQSTVALGLLALNSGGCATGEVPEARLCGLGDCIASAGAAGSPSAGTAGTMEVGGSGSGGSGGTNAGGGRAGSSGGGASGSSGIGGGGVAGNSGGAGGGVGGSSAGGGTGGSGGSGGSSGKGGSSGSGGSGGKGGAGGAGGGSAVNLATGAVAFADSEETGKNNIATNGNDGSTATRWCAADGALDHYWGVDLGQTRQLSGDEVTFEFASRTYGYLVEGSTTSQSAGYTTILDRTTNPSTTQIQSETFTGGARYVRLRFVALPANTWACVSEFKLLGK